MGQLIFGKMILAGDTYIDDTATFLSFGYIGDLVRTLRQSTVHGAPFAAETRRVRTDLQHGSNSPAQKAG